MPYKISAALDFCRANNLDREVTPTSVKRPSLGIATTGKSYLDVLESLSELGLDSMEAITAAGISIFKVGMVRLALPPASSYNIRKVLGVWCAAFGWIAWTWSQLGHTTLPS